MSKTRLELGHDAEDRAVAFLRELGYTIVTRNWKGRRGELDIVALDGDVFVFVEVKFRSDARFLGEPSIDPAKTLALSDAVREYLVKFELEGRETRFDVIAIDPSGLRHHVGAWEP